MYNYVKHLATSSSRRSPGLSHFDEHLNIVVRRDARISFKGGNNKTKYIKIA